METCPVIECFLCENRPDKLQLHWGKHQQSVTFSRLFQQTLYAWNPFDQCKLEIQYSATKTFTERLTVFPPFSQNKKIFAPNKQNSLWSVWQFDGAFLSGNLSENRTKETSCRAFDRTWTQHQATTGIKHENPKMFVSRWCGSASLTKTYTQSTSHPAQ